MPDAATNVLIGAGRVGLHLEEEQFAFCEESSIGMPHGVQAGVDRPGSEVSGLRPVVESVRRFRGGPERRLDPVEALVDRSQEKLLLRGEQSKDVRLGDLDPLRDPLGRGSVQAIDGELGNSRA